MVKVSILLQRPLWLTFIIQSQVDAVLVGKQTVLMDNPLLTVRHESVSKDIVQPYRFVIGRHSRFDANLKLFQSVSMRLYVSFQLIFLSVWIL